KFAGVTSSRLTIGNQGVVNAQSVRRRRCLFLHPPGICFNTPFESFLSGPTVFSFEIAQEYPPRVPVSRLAQRLLHLRHLVCDPVARSLEGLPAYLSIGGKI